VTVHAFRRRSPAARSHSKASGRSRNASAAPAWGPMSESKTCTQIQGIAQGLAGDAGLLPAHLEGLFQAGWVFHIRGMKDRIVRVTTHAEPRPRVKNTISTLARASRKNSPGLISPRKRFPPRVR